MVKRVLIAAILLSLGLVTILFGIQGLGILQLKGFTVYAAIFFLSFLILIFSALRTKDNMKDRLIKIDKQFDLRELLSTSYEAFEQGRKSVFTNIIIRDAAKYLTDIKSKKIFPRRFSKTHLIILIFIIILFNLMSLYFTYAPSMTEILSDTSSSIFTDEIENYAQPGLTEMEIAEEDPLINLYEQMNGIAGNLKENPYQDDDLLRQFEELRDKIETERSRITQKLETELNLEDASETPLINPLRDDISEAELEQFKDTINQLFEGDIPPSLAKEVEKLKNLQKLELLVEKTSDEANQNISEGSPLSALENQENNQNGLGLEDSEPLGGEVIPGKSMEYPAPMVRIPPMEGPKKPGTTETEPDDKESKGEITTSAGFGKNDADTFTTEEPEGLKNSAIRDENLSERGKRYSLQVLSLPLVSETETQEEEILRIYEKEIESVLNKEEIPENYREYIKKYFLSIGIGGQN